MTAPTFTVQNGQVFWQTSEGPAPLRAEDVEAVLAILAAGGLRSLWLDLDQASQAAGYPPSVMASRAA